MKRLLIFSFAAVVLAPAALPQNTQKATVAFSDPSRPRKLEVDMMFGGVTVRGYNGQEMTLETSSREGIRSKGRKEPDPPAGMHRIGGNRDSSRVRARFTHPRRAEGTLLRGHRPRAVEDREHRTGRRVARDRNAARVHTGLGCPGSAE